MPRVKDNYDNGECPDCGMEISYYAENGDECPNCGHIFWGNGEDDEDDGYDDYDGQPDWEQEWHDFDPDC